MANPQFVITQEGLSAARVAYATGIKISITSFKVGASYGFTPLDTDTDIHGSLVYGPATPLAWNITGDDYLDIILKMDLTVGPFDFGNIGIYLSDGTLFALAAWDIQQHKRATLGTVIGNNRIIHAVIKLHQAPVIINVVTNGGGMIMEVPSWADLGPTSSYPDNNCVIVHESNGCNEHCFAIKKIDPFWTPVDYSPYLTSTISASTTTSFTAANVTTRFWDFSGAPNRYIARFADGSIRGVASVSSTTVNLTAALASAPTGSVTIMESICARGFDCTPVASEIDFNALVASYNPVWSTPNGFVASGSASGWNETALPTLVMAKPSNQNWADLINAAYAGATLTASTMGSDFPPNTENFKLCPGDPIQTGLLTRQARFTALKATITEIVANRFRFTNLAAFESTSPSTGLKTRTSTPWTNTTHIWQVDFASAAALQGFFNAGGRLVFSAGVSAGSVNAKETAWRTMFSDQGTLSHTYSDTIRGGTGGTPVVKGMYDLTGSYQTIFSNTTFAASSNMTYVLQGKRTSTTQLMFTLTYGDDNPTALYSSATPGIVMTSQLSLRRAASTVLTTPVHSYPTITQSGTL